MELQRAKRAIKPPKKYSEDEEERPARDSQEAEQPIFVYRLLKKKEVNKDLVNQEVYVLWPDNGIWYKAEVIKLRSKDMKAELEYPKEEEREEVDLTELIKERHIALMEPRVPNHRLRKDEFPVPEDTDTPLISEPVLEMSEDDRTSPEKDKEEEEQEQEEEEDDIPDAGAIEEEPSDASDVSEAAAEQASSSSSGDDPMVAEEEADNLSVPAEEEDEELVDESMDEGEGGLPSLGKRRSTDTAFSAQTAPKRARPGSLAEVARKHGWRPQAASQGPSHPKPLSPKPSSTSTQSPTQPQALRSPTRSSAQPGVAPAGAATAETASHGSDALQSAEAAAARASQIAESVVAAGAAAEEAVADAEDYETASRYAQELLGSLGKPKASAAGGKRFYGPGQSSSLPARPSGVQRSALSQSKQNPQAVRDKVVSNLATSLDKAATELKKEGHSEGLPDATAVARSVEQALQKHFGMDKEYRQKVRSLSYNLSDASNPELRARVLQGEVTPDQLVQMTPNELASKELSQWRQQQLQESLRNSVLDEEAAAKFSTAAALAAKEKRAQMAKANYDKGLLTAVDTEEKAREATPPVRDATAHDTKPFLSHLDSINSAALKPPEVSSPSHPLSPTTHTPPGDFAEDQAAFQGLKSEEEEGKPLGNSSSFSWASIKAHASKLAKDSEAPDSRFKGFDEFMASAKANAAAIKTDTEEVTDTETKIDADDQPYSPSARVTVEDDPDLPDLAGLIGSSGVAGQNEVWHGRLHVPGMFRASVAADMVAGTGDIGRMFTSSEVEVKGRVNLDKLTAFLEQLRVSRSRTVSLGTLMCARDASAADSTHVAELTSMYSSKQRTGVLDLEDGLEAYIIPPCALVDRLLKTAKKSASLADHTAAFIPDTIQIAQLLLVVIHRKDWRPSVSEEGPAYDPALPGSHAESPQPSPADPQASDFPTSSMTSVPGPPQDPPSAPLHSLPMPPETGPPSSLPSAPGGNPNLGGFGSQAPMQQLQAALSAQSQGNVLPAGLDLGSISALAAALGVQGVSLPGAQGGALASASGQHLPSSSGPHAASALPSAPGPQFPGQLPRDASHDPRMGPPRQGDPQQQWGTPQWPPHQTSGLGPEVEHHSGGAGPMHPQEGYGPPEYPPAHPDPYQSPPQQGPPGYAPRPAGNARPGMPLPQPVTLQAPQGGGYPLQPGQGQIQRPLYHQGPAPAQGPLRGPYGPPAGAPGPLPAHHREGLVGWEGLDSVIGGSRRGRDGGRSRGSGGRGREGRARHSGGRGPASGGGRFDHDSSQFERHGGLGSMDGRGRGRQAEGPYLPPPPAGRGRGRSDVYDSGRGFSERGRGGGRGSGEFGRGGRDRGRGPQRGRWQ